MDQLRRPLFYWNALGMMRGFIVLFVLIFSAFTLAPVGAEPEVLQPQKRASWRSVTSSEGQLLRPFEKPATRYTSGHRGVDFAALKGEAVFAPVAASVSYRGIIVDRNVLTLLTVDGILISFEPLESDLQVGDPVVAGQMLGLVSTGAHCSDKCLHVGVRINGEYVNPLRFFAPRPVLLPLVE